MWERNYSADGILLNVQRTVVSVYKKPSDTEKSIKLFYLYHYIILMDEK